jgi:hypothetical protein
MEPDMVVEMVGSVMEQGVQMEAIIGDDDTTAISKIHKDLDANLKKYSDKNHVKKNISNSLYQLQKKHKSLSTRVIQYFKKSFSYMLSQNQGNPSELERGLSALSLHPFGNHTECNGTWCRHKEDAKKKYSSLPYGRPLESKELQEDISDVFNRLKKHSIKLSRLGSTQPNESFNKCVASKAPKTHLYSRSIGYRVAASVAKKNIGQGYLLQVSKNLLCILKYFKKIPT